MHPGSVWGLCRITSDLGYLMISTECLIEA